MGTTNNSDEYYKMGSWVSRKFGYNKRSYYIKIRRTQVLPGEVWYCDLGYNIGTEKNKYRPVLVVSNNKINNSEKVVVICITDPRGKLNANDLSAQDSWYLLYSSTTDNTNKLKPDRIIPANNVPYSFLEKDCMVQCEEIRSVSKARLDLQKGAIGKLRPKDLNKIREKFMRAYIF
ncbi:MAG: type II toxin-antitoxin system PemK/MazF family toxin [Desulfosporosinus sp.]